MDELTRSEEEDLLEERREEEGGEREIGALITYSEGFVCSYGQDSVFIFQQIIQNEEEIRQGRLLHTLQSIYATNSGRQLPILLYCFIFKAMTFLGL